MTIAERLLEEAHYNRIIVKAERLPDDGPKAHFINAGAKVLVIVNPTDTQSEMACLLSEELGHYHTAPLRKIAYKTISDAKAEARVRRWAHRKILPPERIFEALRAGIRERWELAEYLGVTEEFLEETFADYECAGDVDFWYEEEEQHFAQ